VKQVIQVTNNKDVTLKDCKQRQQLCETTITLQTNECYSRTITAMAWCKKHWN